MTHTSQCRLESSLSTRRRLLARLGGCFLVGGGSLHAEDALRVEADKVLRAVRKKVEPEYPLMARRMGVQGVVHIDVDIDAGGELVEAEKVDGHPVLVNAVLKAVRQWEIDPIKVDGEAAHVIARLTFEFKP
ncbi:MAG: TonB family protein [Acidobacteria bacterium]|nr:TonB family protein [Acidobacteriota bacterium]